MTDTNNAEAKNDELAADGKLKRKEYERELTRLHVGLSSSSNGWCTKV
jgi:hypothetical protein